MTSSADPSQRCRELFEESPVFCVLPWLHLCASIDGVWGRCCVDGSIYHEGDYNRPEKPPLPLPQEALGCTPGSPLAPDNPERVLGLQAAFNSPNLRRTRLAMLDGRPVDSCRYCYTREAQGGISYRQNMNRIFRDRADWDALFSATSADGTLPRKPVYLDLRLGNQCNLSCIMCCYPVSSSWKRHVEATWLSGALDPYRDDETFWQEVGELLPALQRVYFAGGEPLLQSSHFRLLDLMLAAGVAHRIELVYNTNLTYLPPGIEAKFAAFQSVEIGASCDGMGETFEKIRRGARWDDFVRNLRSLAPHVRLRLAVTPQRDNVHNLPQLVEWAWQEGFEVDLHNVLHYPEELSLASLSPVLKTRFAPEYARLAATCHERGQARLAKEADAIRHILTIR